MRPPKLVIILRGLPGAGKSTIAKMIKVSWREVSVKPKQILVRVVFLYGSGYDFRIIGNFFFLFQNREVENGGSAPRILCLDDYFMVEVEKMVIDSESNRKVKTKVSCI